MRNVNLNILKFLESVDNFCLSLTNIGLEVSYQLSVISYQLSVISYQFTEKTPLSPLPFPPLHNSGSSVCLMQWTGA
ncbi:MAG: hypothetical protein EWV92_00575 [Microcystis aeruginosa Ma_MB_S_20031200_S102]|uniref:Uncharacterized protein n=1 Tax=Microcystis aeruginosa Ma_MB_S_20031200_S102 TaxID=2486254 RepID=A0A552F8Q9_MICAE|nr:MAG: hypothetical protein EWV79_12385 [Microcystis aeruginosa Ma_MB_S_20031200_S102D]TRU43098.1 MAG: hypothetical protein EWV92_00575 [Microcystis aeruginosa Ma_MB_S_20031200_S102]